MQQSPRMQPRGILNLGNTCYLNAALQLLFRTTLTSYATKAEYDNQSAMDCYKRFLKKYDTVTDNIVPKSLLKMLAANNYDKYLMNRQEDSQELMSHLLDVLEECGTAEQKKEFGKLFDSKLESTLICPDCHHKSVTNTPLRFLSLSLPKSKQHPSMLHSGMYDVSSDEEDEEDEEDEDIEDIEEDDDSYNDALMNEQSDDEEEVIENKTLKRLHGQMNSNNDKYLVFNHIKMSKEKEKEKEKEKSKIEKQTLDDLVKCYSSTEILGKGNEWHCPKCKKNVQAEKQLLLGDLSPNVIVHFKRLHMFYKNSEEIIVPMEWKGKQLNGIVVHDGGIHGGHYYGYIKHDNKWYCTNDNSVREVEIDHIQKEANGGYLLLYQN